MSFRVSCFLLLVFRCCVRAFCLVPFVSWVGLVGSLVWPGRVWVSGLAALLLLAVGRGLPGCPGVVVVPESIL